MLGAVGLPWLATWQGVLMRPKVDRVVAAPELVQYRPELVLVPGGKFRMGSSEAERSAFAKFIYLGDELAHDAEVEALVVCRTEVSREQWRSVMGRDVDPCKGCGDYHPVVSTWYEACSYMVELTRRENDMRAAQGEAALTTCYVSDSTTCTWTNLACTGFRLPTETEWEYVARAGTTTPYWFGANPTEMCAYGNGKDLGTFLPTVDKPSPDETMFKCEDGHRALAPVGSYAPNAWGLYDVHGNAAEWVWDRYERSFPPEADRLGYSGPSEGDVRVVRGGSYLGSPVYLRAASRGSKLPEYRGTEIGMRCVRSAT